MRNSRNDSSESSNDFIPMRSVWMHSSLWVIFTAWVLHLMADGPTAEMRYTASELFVMVAEITRTCHAQQIVWRCFALLPMTAFSLPRVSGTTSLWKSKYL